MNWKINIIIAVIFTSCNQEKGGSINKTEEQKYLIEVEELNSIIDQPNIKIIDFRKNEHYLEEHITGALNIKRLDIEDQSYDYGGMMASKLQIEQLFSNLGIDNDDQIIIYDDNGLCDSSRLWWVLQYYNFKNIKMLHGGIEDWKAIGGNISNSVKEINKTTFKLSDKTNNTYYISKPNVFKALTQNTLIIDTRTSDEFSGVRKKRGAFKGGRIPKSLNIDWAEAINYNSDKKLKSITELESIYGNLNKSDTIIVYCHSGVRSAHTTFVLTQLLGFKNVRNYDGSWTEWSHFNDLPFEKDSIILN